ncbi:MAG: hypothetical protein V7K41_18290 [Nostoc sp.]|uniref:hypothetical protein n=1 Tax=Nostoc sp. TaxID=1180 RepID=UPI002FFCED93
MTNDDLYGVCAIYKRISLIQGVCLWFLFPLQVLSALSQLTLREVDRASTDLSQCAEPLP